MFNSTESDENKSTTQEEKKTSPRAKPFGRFATRTEALENARRILKGWETSLYIPITGQDADDVQAMFDNHPIARKLAGKGVGYHFVGRDDLGSRGFRTMRIDGTDKAWSYKTAISAQRRSAKDKLRQVLRQEIRGQIEAFLSDWRTSTDYDPAVEAEGAEVDHVEPSFAELASDFEQQLIERCGTLDAVEIVRRGVGGFRFADRSLAEAWRQFHADRATLEVVSRSEHKQRTRERRVMSADNDNARPCTEAAYR